MRKLLQKNHLYSLNQYILLRLFSKKPIVYIKILATSYIQATAQLLKNALETFELQLGKKSRSAFTVHVKILNTRGEKP